MTLRRWNYEVFQYVHLLMYPLFALLAMHGTARLCKLGSHHTADGLNVNPVAYPMLGFWLVGPVVLVLAERLTRAVRSFAPHPARLEALDDGTIVVTAEKPSHLTWRASAGQYVGQVRRSRLEPLMTRFAGVFTSPSHLPVPMAPFHRQCLHQGSFASPHKGQW